MAKTPWKSASLAMLTALLLAGCGNGDEEPAPQEAPATEEVPAEASPGEDAVVDEAPVERGESALESDEVPPAPQEEDAPAEPAEGGVEADTETLGESPSTTLDEGAALPGETTRDEIDAIIEEQERRFEEASRRIDEQFEEAEEEPVLPEFGEGDEVEFDYGSSINDDPAGGPDRSEIDAIIEEQERRFEEAQRRLEEQFEEMERERPQEYLEFDEPTGSPSLDD